MRTRLVLTVGQSVTAKVVEIIVGDVLVVDIDGHLFRVRNRTDRRWKAQEQIHLRVTALNPIEFQILSAPKGFDRFA